MPDESARTRSPPRVAASKRGGRKSKETDESAEKGKGPWGVTSHRRTFSGRGPGVPSGERRRLTKTREKGEKNVEGGLSHSREEFTGAKR